MTEQEKRIRLAEFEGWRNIVHFDGILLGEDPNGERKTLPKYLDCLNAVNNIEIKLTETQREEHGRVLQEITCNYPVGCVPNYRNDLRSISRIASSSAYIRANALGETLKLW